MSVYKEVRDVVELVKRNSQQVWSDAADYGYPVRDLNDGILKEVKSIIVDYYRVKPVTKKHLTGATQTLTIEGGVSMVLEAGFSKAVFSFTTVRDKVYKGILSVQTFTSEADLAAARRIDY